MSKKKKIIFTIILLVVMTLGCGIAALFHPLGKLRRMLMRFSIIAFLALLLFLAGLMKGR